MDIGEVKGFTPLREAASGRSPCGPPKNQILKSNIEIRNKSKFFKFQIQNHKLQINSKFKIQNSKSFEFIALVIVIYLGFDALNL